MRLLIDENVASAKLVDLLRKAGHDVETAVTALGSGTPDNVVADYAAAESRVLLTKDVEDFQRLYGAYSTHCGLLLIYEGHDGTRASSETLATAIGNIEATYRSIASMILHINEFIW